MEALGKHLKASPKIMRSDLFIFCWGEDINDHGHGAGSAYLRYQVSRGVTLPVSRLSGTIPGTHGGGRRIWDQIRIQFIHFPESNQ